MQQTQHAPAHTISTRDVYRSSQYYAGWEPRVSVRVRGECCVRVRVCVSVSASVSASVKGGDPQLGPMGGACRPIGHVWERCMHNWRMCTLSCAICSEMFSEGDNSGVDAIITTLRFG